MKWKNGTEGDIRPMSQKQVGREMLSTSHTSKYEVGMMGEFNNIQREGTSPLTPLQQGQIMVPLPCTGGSIIYPKPKQDPGAESEGSFAGKPQLRTPMQQQGFKVGGVCQAHYSLFAQRPQSPPSKCQRQSQSRFFASPDLVRADQTSQNASRNVVV
ncbi:hypothetical protein BDDG_04708 [Blastomyces dermatitidis ATCC 18188]|uniref:Uncharacterized protein n=1 Tax=Ajellomyces dermatitidis (strain ATCC 18188 / CBS 674.68) TaxID=653446 RepID=F2TEY0_AJEDA|nr:hypothetical protein BDDG_04708 [Blastomyces dermatitidis ATCC 18188]